MKKTQVGGEKKEFMSNLILAKYVCDLRAYWLESSTDDDSSWTCFLFNVAGMCVCGSGV